MAALESASSFKARATAIGITAAIFRDLESANLDTFGKFAFACQYQPGNPDETAFVELIKRVIKRDPDMSELSVLRRLYFESHTLALSDMKSRIERTDEDVPKRLPAPERQARRSKQIADYPGLDIQGDVEPAHQLVDRCCQQLEDGILRYIPLYECPSREQEVLKTRKEPMFAFDHSGNIKLTKQETAIKSDISSELRVKNAMIRRALAYDQSGLATFTVLDKWTNRVFHVMSKEVPQGYKKVSMEQVIAADKQLFVKVAEETRTGLIPMVGVAKPMDTAFSAAISDPEVVYCMLPLPESGSSRTENKHRPQPYQDPRREQPRKENPPSAGKGGSKTSGKFSLPDGCVSMANGKPLCFNFNTGKCKAAKPGKRCRWGFHLCYKQGCHKAEPFATCKH